ncbi:transglutaminaseTgpA domain-containing protein [Fontisphaera persica]|uniref:transglutaminase TgpA family protein n=1 Tax=Fontisphaera persica TaxID=2974023 RepID=UPI0024C01EAA|nr:transglutaminaseTgpA domain-containing protein [Fontisphaera persica]WCJ59615.1 transglutaminaseTgpA domain-containing protein [Fontisphaera persica]
MKSARNQLVLLGLLCMGLTWNDWVMPGLYALLWGFCLRAGRRPIHLGPAGEALLLVGGAFVGHTVARWLGYSAHFAIGHGLAFLQLGRLLRPLNRREQWFSLLIALFHLAVACTFLFDYRFLAVVAAAVWCVPRALAELAAEGGLAPSYSRPPARLLGRDAVLIALVMVGLFLLFPRGWMSGGMRWRIGRAGDETTLLDTVMDPASRAGGGGQRILFQIRGEQLGYLRCYTLAHFDGQRWRISTEDYRWRLIEAGGPEDLPASALERQLRIKNPAFLGRVLPVDGHVLRLQGTFFHRAYETRQGMVETDVVFTRQNNFCTYWIRRPAPWRALRPADRTALLWHPPPSPRLREWLDAVLAGETNAYQQARLLEKHLETHYTYDLGAPELNRLNALEDFLFQQRRGHCERFAAALAQLLRVQGIPSRVVIGYLPRTRNPLSGWYDIRLRDAHAWTEAWFPERGWERFDATPASTLPPPSAWSDWLEALDFAWYAHVVNFDRASQNALVDTLAQAWQTAYATVQTWLRRSGGWLWGGVALAVGSLLCLRFWQRRSWRGWRRAAAQDAECARALAGHYYGRMLRLLARRGLRRQPHQTPLEFLETLAGARLPDYAEAVRITQTFCLTHYGGQPMMPETQRELDDALKRMEATQYAAKM